MRDLDAWSCKGFHDVVSKLKESGEQLNKELVDRFKELARNETDALERSELEIFCIHLEEAVKNNQSYDELLSYLSDRIKEIDMPIREKYSFEKGGSKT